MTHTHSNFQEPTVVAEITDIIEKGSDINKKLFRGRTYFHHAAMSCDIDLMKMCIAAGADVNAKDNDGNNAIFLMAKQHPSDDAIDFLWGKVDFYDKNNARDSIIHHATRLNRRGVVTKLLALDAAMLFSTDKEKFTPIHLAACNDREFLLDIMLRFAKTRYEEFYNSDKEKFHTDPAIGILQEILFWEVSPRIIKMLLDYGFDINSVQQNRFFDINSVQKNRSVTGETPLVHSILEERHGTTALLIDYGVNINKPGEHNTYPIIAAAVMKNLWAMKKLIQAGANVNNCDENKYTPLMFASQSNNAEGIKMLIQAGAAVDMRDDENGTALHHAARWGNVEGVENLLDFGASINAVDFEGWSPIAYAVGFNDKKTAEVLIKRGSDTTISPDGEDSPQKAIDDGFFTEGDG